MNAVQIDEAIAKALPVVFATQRHGAIVGMVIERDGQKCLVRATGNLRDVPAKMRRMADVAQMKPEDIAMSFVPPGAFFTTKIYSVVPAGTDHGVNPYFALTSLRREYSTIDSHLARMVASAFKAASEVFAGMGMEAGSVMTSDSGGVLMKPTWISRWLMKHAVAQHKVYLHHPIKFTKKKKHARKKSV